MTKRKVRLELWVHYDSESGYVWPQVYETEEEASIDLVLNYPIKVLKLTSESYFSKGKEMGVTGSFGTEIPIKWLL